MSSSERPLVESTKHAEGRYGGFGFGGQKPDGVVVHHPLPPGHVFPNGARCALLMTYDVEGTYGNGAGDMAREIANYRRLCDRFRQNGIPATFNVVGLMAEERGPEFVEWMIEAGCEVAPHGYVHDMNKRYGGDRVYAGHYGPKENREQVADAARAIRAACGDAVRGFRLPYGHFNEYSYDAIADQGLAWSSNVGADDMTNPELGFGYAPFQIGLGDKVYPLVEIPLDSQTFDWAVWVADESANPSFVASVRRFCETRDVPFDRTPSGAVAIWKARIAEAIANRTCFTLLCHPINLCVMSDRWGDPVDEFMLPIVDELGRRHRAGEAWVCTCGQLADEYWKWRKEASDA